MCHHASLPGRHGGSVREAWWLSGSVPDCCPAVPGSNPASPQPTSDCQSSGGLPPGMVLGCGLTSVRDDGGENYDKWPAGLPKTYKEKNMLRVWEEVYWIILFYRTTHLYRPWQNYLLCRQQLSVQYAVRRTLRECRRTGDLSSS